jgi:hypothetical protein
MPIRELATTIKDFITAAGILLGGSWTVYTFTALGTKSKAEAERFKQAVIKISVDATQEQAAGLPESLAVVSVVATVTNNGSRNTYLDFKARHPFEVYRYSFDGTGAGKRELILQLHTDYKGGLVRMGAALRIPVCFIASPGFYFIRFMVSLEQEELKIYRSSAKPGSIVGEGQNIFWDGFTFLNVV